MIKLSIFLTLFFASLQFGTFLPQDLFKPFDDIIEPVKSFFPISSYCTQDSVLNCANQIKSSFEKCKKAVKSDLANIQADYSCIVDVIKDKAACVPCICGQAKQFGLHIIGC